MILSDRIVTQLPLTTLWTNEGGTTAQREKYLNKETIRKLLKQTPVAFVVADSGSKLNWMPIDKCYKFWKEEVQNHVADNPDKIFVDDFFGGYAFIASQWTSENNLPITLLEKVH